MVSVISFLLTLVAGVFIILTVAAAGIFVFLRKQVGKFRRFAGGTQQGGDAFRQNRQANRQQAGSKPEDDENRYDTMGEDRGEYVDYEDC